MNLYWIAALALSRPATGSATRPVSLCSSGVPGCPGAHILRRACGHHAACLRAGRVRVNDAFLTTRVSLRSPGSASRQDLTPVCSVHCWLSGCRLKPSPRMSVKKCGYTRWYLYARSGRRRGGRYCLKLQVCEAWRAASLSAKRRLWCHRILTSKWREGSRPASLFHRVSTQPVPRTSVVVCFRPPLCCS
jgi:hypothetical protein